jgi:hypothetical protein
MSGVLVHYYEMDFETKFDYPLKGDIRKYMEQLRLGQELEQVKKYSEKNYFMKRKSSYVIFFWSFGFSHKTKAFQQSKCFLFFLFCESVGSSLFQYYCHQKAYNYDDDYDLFYLTIFSVPNKKDKKYSSKKHAQHFNPTAHCKFVTQTAV